MTKKEKDREQEAKEQNRTPQTEKQEIWAKNKTPKTEANTPHLFVPKEKKKKVHPRVRRQVGSTVFGYKNRDGWETEGTSSHQHEVTRTVTSKTGGT